MMFLFKISKVYVQSHKQLFLYNW